MAETEGRSTGEPARADSVAPEHLSLDQHTIAPGFRISRRFSAFWDGLHASIQKEIHTIHALAAADGLTEGDRTILRVTAADAQDTLDRVQGVMDLVVIEGLEELDQSLGDAEEVGSEIRMRKGRSRNALQMPSKAEE